MAGVYGARLMRRLGLQRLTLLTSAAAMVGFIILTQLPSSGGYNPILAAVILVGFGTAGASYVSMIGATNGMADSDQGFVGGAINTSRQIGAAVGAALLPAIAVAVSPGTGAASVRGDRAAMLAGAVVAGLAIIVSLRFGMAARRASVKVGARRDADRPGRTVPRQLLVVTCRALSSHVAYSPRLFPLAYSHSPIPTRLFPLDGARRFARYVEHHPVDLLHLVGYPGRDPGQQFVRQAGKVGRHGVFTSSPGAGRRGARKSGRPPGPLPNGRRPAAPPGTARFPGQARPGTAPP